MSFDDGAGRRTRRAPWVVRRARYELRRLRARLRRRGVVLVYHRIVDPDSTAFSWVVDPARFARQMALLRERYLPLSLTELAARAQHGGLPRNAVAVTFDDGYTDFSEVVVPVVERLDIPVTVFAVSGAVAGGEAFWWDEIEALVLRPRRPAPLAIVVDGLERSWPMASHADRRTALAELLGLAKPMASAQRARLLEAVREWAGGGVSRDQLPQVMSAAELRRAASLPLVTVGAHTVSHAHLASLAGAELAAEIEGSRRALEELTDTPVETFAYPYGGRDDISPGAVAAVRQAGFKVACTNVGGLVAASSDPHLLPRCPVHDWDQGRFAVALQDDFLGD